jgi:hypothetical protein
MTPAAQSPLLASALWYAKVLHWHVFPLRPREKTRLRELLRQISA